ncbi:hypothetical protein LCGC14_3143450, partial [marine sediment metagenome]
NIGSSTLDCGAFTATDLTVSGTGPHAIGGATSATYSFYLRGSFTPASGAHVYGFRTGQVLTARNGSTEALAVFFSSTIATAGDGATYGDVAELVVNDPTITKNGADIITNATSLKIIAAPSEGLNNRALWVVSGETELQALTVSGTMAALDMAGQIDLNNNNIIAGGTAAFVTAVLLGGADLNFSLNSTVIASAQNGTATIAHSGFTDGNDKLIFFIGTDISAEDSANSGINNSFGVCHVTGSDGGGYAFVQRCMGWASDHGNNDGSPSAILSTEHVLDIVTETGTEDWALEVTAFSSSSNTITVTTRDAGAGANMEVYSLALDLDDRSAAVGSTDG